MDPNATLEPFFGADMARTTSVTDTSTLNPEPDLDFTRVVEAEPAPRTRTLSPLLTVLALTGGIVTPVSEDRAIWNTGLKVAQTPEEVRDALAKAEDKRRRKALKNLNSK